MGVDEALLRLTREAHARWEDALAQADEAKGEYHQLIRRIHLSGGSLREIAESLGVSHQRVHQIIEATGGLPDWKPRRPTTQSCSFCGRSQQTVAKLVAGQGVLICDRCIAAASGSRVGGGLDVVTAESGLACSFCGKGAAEVTRLVGRPSVWICDGCVAFCAEVVASLP